MKLRCFNADVNKAKKIIITHCPRANKNNSITERIILLEIAAKAIILASRGEEHGLAASENNAPIKKGKTNMLPVLF